MDKKKCSKCGVVKELTKFYKDKKGKHGVRTKCKECISEYDKTLKHKKHIFVERKKCTKCHKIKDRTCFTKNRKSKTGLRYECKDCEKEYRIDNRERTKQYKAQYYQDNKNQIAQDGVQYRQDHKEQIAHNNAKYRQNNKEQIAQRGKTYRQNNKEQIKQCKARHYQDNKEQIAKRNAEYNKNHKEQLAQYRKDNKEKLNQQRNKWKKKRRAIDPIWTLKHNLSVSLRKQLNNLGHSKNNIPTFSLLEITTEEFEVHFDYYLGNMCERCGRVVITHNPKNYELDHIIPISLAQTKAEVLQFNLLGNLRLICKKCNQDKHDKIELIMEL